MGGTHDAASAEAPASKSSISSTKQDRLARFKALSEQRNAARRLNKAEVVDEDARSKVNKNHERKRQKAQYQLDKEAERAAVEAAGGDYDRQILLDTSIEKSERWAEKKSAQHTRKKAFGNHEEVAARSHDRSFRKGFHPDMDHYERTKAQQTDGDSVSGYMSTYGGEGKVETKHLQRLTDAVDANVQRKMKSKRDEFFEEADVDYINSQNEKFNKKLQRYYNPHTREIKANLERGTAL